MYLSEQLSLSGGRPTGFDYMRIILAFSIIWVHTSLVVYGDDLFLWQSPLRPILKSILPMFFILSGFLVAGSLERSKTMVSFLGNRVIRIYPALVVEVFLSALLLGVIYTEYELYDYFTDPEFFRYLVNATGHIHYSLPGVFLNNPDSGIVNIQLWTVPFELECYIVLTALFIGGILKRRILAPISTVGIAVVYCLARYWKHGADWTSMPTATSGNLLICAFLAGVTFYLYRDRIRWDARIFTASLLFVIAAYQFTSVGDIITIPAVAYLTIFLGVASPRKIAVLKGADYSYGVFLYGYPIQQALVASEIYADNWVMNGIISSLIVVVFAGLSWTFVEKPALRMKQQVTSLENWVLQLRGKRAPSMAAVK